MDSRLSEKRDMVAAQQFFKQALWKTAAPLDALVSLRSFCTLSSDRTVTNYLTNALRYAPVSEPIIIGITIEDQTACVWVRDQGPGLSEQAQQNI